MQKSRSPVVTILGHVDHGKTTLLDYLRKTHITDQEHGGITQKIGAYEIDTKIKGYDNNKITFIDTPGHEAFSQLRARGAHVSDIAILLIDGRDSVMPQTIESVSHIQTANIPYLVTVNKMDLPDVNIEKIKKDLAKNKVLVEDMGGRIPLIPISAKTGDGVNELLEAILLVASDLHLKFNPQSPPQAYIIETKKDRRGIVPSAIMKEGKLKIGDIIYVEKNKTKVRLIVNDRGESIKEVFPSTPFEILGFEKMPPVGALVTTVYKPEEIKEESTVKEPEFQIDSFLQPVQEDKKLSLIIKTDSQGSLEAVETILKKNKNIKIILSAVGDIYKSDIFLAKTTKSIVIGFNVRIETETKDVAKQEKVIIKTYNIIYELIEELTEVTNLLKEKEEKEKNLKGEAKVLASFDIEKEKVVGVKMTKGKINLGDSLEVYRKTNPIGKTKLVSLKIRAKKVQEVKKDQEAGMIVSPPLDIRVGDVIKCIL